MVDIIGVNHVRYDKSFSGLITVAPEISENLLKLLEGKNVGLESVSQEQRINNLFNFYFSDENFDFPNQLVSLYNPRMTDYFYELKPHLSSHINLDSDDLSIKLMELSDKYKKIRDDAELSIHSRRPMNEEHFYMFFPNEIDSFSGFDNLDLDMHPEDAYIEHCKEVAKNHIDGELIIKKFLTRQKAQKISIFDRDQYMLNKILSSGVDAAVVGLSHAINWQKQGLGFDFWMEDLLLNELELQNLDINILENIENTEFQKELKLDEIVKWQSNFDLPSRKKPLYMGLTGCCEPKTYFEIFKENGKFILQDSYGVSCVDIIRNNDSINIIRNSSIAFGNKEPKDFQYSAKFNDGIAIGKIKGTWFDFILTEYRGTPIDMMKSVYNLPWLQNFLSRTPDDEIIFMTNPIPKKVIEMIPKKTKYSNKYIKVPF